MKALSITLVALIVLIQYPLWLGKGSWFRVWEVDRQIKDQTAWNARLQTRNTLMQAEVRDLKQGLEAIEERARSELGMIKQDEIFFQLLEPGHSEPPSRATGK
jgi:cell division protein FtsB